MLGSLFLHLPPLLLPTGPHCLALAGLQDLSTPICPWLLLLTFCHSVSSPLDSPILNHTHSEGSCGVVLCQAFVVCFLPSTCFVYTRFKILE